MPAARFEPAGFWPACELPTQLGASGRNGPVNQNITWIADDDTGKPSSLCFAAKETTVHIDSSTRTEHRSERARFNRGGLPLRTPEFLPTRRISTPPTRFGILYRIGCFSAPAQPIASLPHPVRTMRNNIRHRRINPNRNRTTSPPHIARKCSGEFIPTPLPYAHSKLRNTEAEMRRLYVGGSGVPGFRSRDSKGPGVGVPDSPLPLPTVPDRCPDRQPARRSKSIYRGKSTAISRLK